MKSKVGKVSTIVAGLLFVVLIPLGACAPEETAPPTPGEVTKPEEIVFYHIGDITGPYASLTGVACTAFAEDWQRYHEELGGLRGVPIRLELNDTVNERKAALIAYSRIRELNPIFLEIDCGDDVDMLKDRVGEDRICTICVSPGATAVWPPGWIFQSNPEYGDFVGLFVDWLSEEWAKTGQTRKCRLAMFNTDQNWGHAHVTSATMEYIESKGNIEFVGVMYFDPRGIDFSTDLLVLAEKEPDWVYVCAVAGQPAVVLRSAETVGIRDKIKWAMSEWGTGIEVGRICGAELIDGVIGQLGYACWADDNPGATKIKELFEEKVRPPEAKTHLFQCYWLMYEMGFAAAEYVVDQWGWENLDSEHMYQAMKSMPEHNVLGGLQPYVLAPGKISPLYARMLQYRGIQPYPITDWTPCPDVRPAEFRTEEYKWEGRGWPEGWFK